MVSLGRNKLSCFRFGTVETHDAINTCWMLYAKLCIYWEVQCVADVVSGYFCEIID